MPEKKEGYGWGRCQQVPRCKPTYLGHTQAATGTHSDQHTGLMEEDIQAYSLHTGRLTKARAQAFDLKVMIMYHTKVMLHQK